MINIKKTLLLLALNTIFITGTLSSNIDNFVPRENRSGLDLSGKAVVSLEGDPKIIFEGKPHIKLETQLSISQPSAYRVLGLTLGVMGGHSIVNNSDKQSIQGIDVIGLGMVVAGIVLIAWSSYNENENKQEKSVIPVQE